jgi:ligand-binding SRPBCC domain-containing protein
LVRIQLITEIAAPIERCFDLSRSIDLHLMSVDWSSEQAIAGVATGLIGRGQDVTWRGRHFGVMITHTSRITAYQFPTYFQDSMVSGAFRSYCHDHHFESCDGGTMMRDDVKFASPYGIMGVVAERILLERHMRGLLERRNSVIKRAAESDAWKKFLEKKSGEGVKRLTRAGSWPRPAPN